MANTTVPAELINTATPLGRRNILINGDFGIYQRAQQVTGLGAASEYYTADRWRIEGASGISGRFTMTAGTEDAPAESNVTTSLKLDCTTADTSLAAGEYLILQQLIEGQNLQHVKKGTSGAKQLTVSFWIKGNASATYIAELYDADNTRQVSKSFSVTSSWSKVEITFPADTTGAFGNDANVSLYCQIWLAAGSNFTSGTLSETWTSSTNANRAVGVSNFYSSTSNELYITAWQLEVGDVATEFEILSYPERLALCQRYFQKYGPYGTNVYPLGPSGYCYAGTAHALGHNPIVSLRANPDLEITGTLQIRGAQNDGGNDARDVASATVTLGNNSILWNVNAAAGGTIGTTPIVGGGTNTTFFAYDAEL